MPQAVRRNRRPRRWSTYCSLPVDSSARHNPRSDRARRCRCTAARRSRARPLRLGRPQVDETLSQRRVVEQIGAGEREGDVGDVHRLELLGSTTSPPRSPSSITTSGPSPCRSADEPVADQRQAVVAGGLVADPVAGLELVTSRASGTPTGWENSAGRRRTARARRQRVVAPLVEVAGRERDGRDVDAGIDPHHRARPAEVSERARRVARAGPVRHACRRGSRCPVPTGTDRSGPRRERYLRARDTGCVDIGGRRAAAIRVGRSSSATNRQSRRPLDRTPCAGEPRSAVAVIPSGSNTASSR